MQEVTLKNLEFKPTKLLFTTFINSHIFNFCGRQSNNSLQSCFLANSITTSDENITRERPSLIQITIIIKINITSKSISGFCKLQTCVKSTSHG